MRNAVREAVAPCHHCGSRDLHRSRRRLLERALSLFDLYPYRCLGCTARILRRGASLSARADARGTRIPLSPPPRPRDSSPT
jgi:DNA-directed RNA polymerase subunit RPC12/RpoP